jgi:hypothetical protein
VRAIVDRQPLVVERLEVIRLLGDWIAEALEVSRRVHHFYERIFDSPGKALIID